MQRFASCRSAQNANMSKTPLKKKSCFQITSVTPAQEPVGGIPHHADGNDHPDESRTKLCVEARNNEGEPRDGQLPHTRPANEGLSFNKSPATDRDTPHHTGGSVPGSPASRPCAHTPITSTVPPASVVNASPVRSSTSRFRVIKLDHGIGLPFRRGRWTCTEFYDRDSDLNQTVDRLKTVVSPFSHTAERDSGLGSTSFSASAFPMQVVDGTSESGSSASVEHPSETHKGYSLHPQTESRVSAFQSPSPRSMQQQVVSQTQPSALSSPPVSSTTSTPDTSGQNVPPVVPKTTSTPPSVPSQTVDTEGPVQPQGALGGDTASSSKQINDWTKKNALPQNCDGVMAVKDHMKLFLSDDLHLSTPTANSLVAILNTMNADEDSTSTASVVALDNKIEQAMDLVKSHLLYAVREEVEVLKEHIKELVERNSLLERENAMLKSLANSEQLNQLSSQLRHGSTSPPPLQ